MNPAYEVRDGYLYVKVKGEFVPSTARDVFFEREMRKYAERIKRATDL